MQCNEAFAGAPQRKMQMQQQQEHQQNMQQASVWGGVAASFLGAAAGSVISHSFEDSYDSYSSPSSVDSFDISDVSDDTDFDFGGDD